MAMKTNGDMPAMPIQLADGEVWSEECDTADGDVMFTQHYRKPL